MESNLESRAKGVIFVVACADFESNNRNGGGREGKKIILALTGGKRLIYIHK